MPRPIPRMFAKWTTYGRHSKGARTMRGWQIRPADVHELATAFDIYREYEFGGEPQSAPQDVPAYLHHVRETGRVLVAEQGGTIGGFAGLVTRGGVSFLTDLFVRPTLQSASLGRALLTAILPAGGVRCTCSTTDPRALALYTRAEMQPVWPQFALYGEGQIAIPASVRDITISAARLDDPGLIAWEAELGGRLRAQDLDFWNTAQRGVALWFRRGGKPIGYAIMRLRDATIRHPGAITIGPLGVCRVEDTAACTLAALGWARGQGGEVCLTLPGPHPALAPLLAAGLRIEDSYIFVASDGGAFSDPRRYISSGADLF